MYFMNNESSVKEELHVNMSTQTHANMRTIAQHVDTQIPTTQGGFFMTLLDFVPLPFSSFAIFTLLSFVWPTERCLLTGTVVCILQTWDDTHPRGEGRLLILCAFVFSSPSVSLSISPSFPVLLQLANDAFPRDMMLALSYLLALPQVGGHSHTHSFISVADKENLVLVTM